MERWEYCLVYGGWQQAWVYCLREDQPDGYSEERYKPDTRSTFKIVAGSGNQVWEAFNVQPKFSGAVDPTKCTFSQNFWFLGRAGRDQ